jgi:hypothetical protein
MWLPDGVLGCIAAYVQQYAPSLGAAVLRRVGPSRARALSAGRSGYDVSAMLQRSAE